MSSTTPHIPATPRLSPRELLGLLRSLRRADPASLRAAWWAQRAVRQARRQLAGGGIERLDVPAPPALPSSAGRGVAAVLNRRGERCLVSAAVWQQWHLAHGVARDLVIGVTAPGDELRRPRMARPRGRRRRALRRDRPTPRAPVSDPDPLVPPGGELRLGTGLEWREVEGEIVALDLDRSVYLAANASGALMWRQLSTGATREALVELLARTYTLERGTAERDVDAFLAELQRQGYLRPAAA